MLECYREKEMFHVPLEGVLYAEAFDDTVFIVTSKGEFRIRMRLYEFENQNKSLFIRVNKSNVVNVMKIIKIVPLFNSLLKLVLSNGTKIYVTRTYLKSFKHYLLNRGEGNDY